MHRKPSSLPASFKVIGHRGAAGLRPENTLPAFALAIELGCTMLELDVHRTKTQAGEAELCVIHDHSVSRTTNKTGALSRFTLEELQALDCGESAGVPSLQEVMGLLDGLTAAPPILNIELKGPHTAALVAEQIRYPRSWNALVSSFHHDELHLFRTLDPHTPVAPLFSRWTKRVVEIAQGVRAQAVNLSTSAAKLERIQLLHQQGFEVYVYTVNDVETAERLKRWGVSGVFTDRPDRLMPLQQT